MSKDALRRRARRSSKLRRWLWPLAALLSLHAGAAEPTQNQRSAFRAAYAAAQQGGDGWRSLAAGLADYPLYPYLEAAALSHDLRQLDRSRVQSYLARYPDLIPAADLRRDFLLELARRQDWTDFLALYQPGINDTLACDALKAHLAQGDRLDFDQDLTALWSKPSLPSACDDVLEAAHAQGLLTTARLWGRIDRAVAAGQGGSIAQLASWLPADQTAAGQRLAQALNDPGGAVAAAVSWPDAPRYRQAAAIALQRLARRQSASADAGWQTLQGHFQFTEEQRNDILRALAVFHATDFDANALGRLAALPPAANDDVSREWRVRVALAARNWPAALAALDALTAEQRQQDEWRYFRGRVLEQLGRRDEARAAYAVEARETGYFGFMAADRLGQPYAICPLALDTDAQREQALLARPGLRRAFELFAVDLPRQARREWAQALADADTQTLKYAVDLAYRRGWYDRAAFVLNRGDNLRYYELRFPLASQYGLVAQAQQAGIEPAWAYGILRIESAWASDARSGADARGLMQLLPDTAAEVARRNGLGWSGSQSLYVPATNIALGTRYLAQLAQRYDGSPWLTSAAYNAGPGRVDQWLNARDTLDPDLFVASMPFKDTRDYVALVMYFTAMYDWRLHEGKLLRVSQRMPRIGQAFDPPAADAPRIEAACPAAPAAAEPAPVPAAASAPAPAASR